MIAKSFSSHVFAKDARAQPGSIVEKSQIKPRRPKNMYYGSLGFMQ